VLPRVRPEPEAIATYKLATGFLAVPLTLLLVGLAGTLLAGPGVGIAAATAALLLGLLAIGWHERWWRVREDLRLFLQVLRRPRVAAALAARRASLARDFERVLERMQAEGTHSIV
jgi:hypothetical protein